MLKIEQSPTFALPMLYGTLSDIQAALLRGEFSHCDLVRHYLKKIDAARDLNAWVETWADDALARAARLDERLQSEPGQLGKLFGAVVGIKDNICFAGKKASASSKILEGFSSLFSATAVERLLAEDAVIIGRTNCDEFGMGSSNENSVYGPVKNAADPSRISGGSSGGAAVAVQTGGCLVALGSDTGGSIRQPAGFCGLYGFKPSYGRISRHGLIAYASSFDQIGIIAQNPENIAAFLDVMQGPDHHDDTTLLEKAPPARAVTEPVSIAYIPETLESEAVDPGVRAVAKAYLVSLENAGHRLVPVSFDLLEYIIPAYYVLTTAEASSNLARFDGIRYGYRNPDARNLYDHFVKTRTEGFGEEVRRRILLGSFVLSAGYYDAYYSKAQQARRLIRNRINDILKDHPFIFLPVAPNVAWRFGEKSEDPVAVYLSDIYTVAANLAGIPALAVPAGLHPDNGMPVGVQFMASANGEYELLAFAQRLVVNA